MTFENITVFLTTYFHCSKLCHFITARNNSLIFRGSGQLDDEKFCNIIDNFISSTVSFFKQLYGSIFTYLPPTHKYSCLFLSILFTF